MTTGRPLWSERHGGDLSLTDNGFLALIESALGRAKEEGLFEEAFGYRESLFGQDVPGLYVQVEFFTMRMGDPWASRVLDTPFLVELQQRDQIYDLLELLYREVVSSPMSENGLRIGFNREAGRIRFRAFVAPVLERLDPPLELDASGDIVEGVSEPFRRLVEQPLPDDAPKREVVDRVEDAIRQFRRRGATSGERRAAVRDLVDALEFLRPQAKQKLMSEDERALFQLANGFTIRHNKRETRRDFDEPAWLAWAFYVYLATVRLLLELQRRPSEA